MKRLSVLLLTVALPCIMMGRNCQKFDEGWLFVLADSTQMSTIDYNDGHWRKLNLPHDWSIEQDFMASAPAGAGGGALPGGVGWYRKHFKITKEDLSTPKGSLFSIIFDGVYMNSTVYLNGKELGTRPYGFISFEYDLTPYLREGDNVLAVRVDNHDQPNCRWYSGSGIYRHVYLQQTAATHVRQWGTFANASLAKNMKTATFNIQTEIENATPDTRVEHILLDAEGRQVAKSVGGKWSESDGFKTNVQTFKLRNPRLWSVDNPHVYTVRTNIRIGNLIVDVYESNAGVRTFRFDSETGFSLNSVPMKINGVCQHHDLGMFGAAINEDAMHRQLVKLKEMGCNAIRCSHNPPAQELLNMCDTMGFIVMDEAFDMWHRKKTQYDYSRYFDKWAEKDLTDFIRRDRNHPSIFMWSIGNEVLEQWSSDDGSELSIEQANLILNFGHDASTLSHTEEMSANSLLTKKLADVVRALDHTRLITAGCNEPDPNNHLYKSGALDIIGYNYHNQNVADVPKNFPGKPFIFTESISALMTRGFYLQPSDSVIKAPLEWWLPYTDPSFMCSAYDNCRASWGNHHEETWDLIQQNPFVSGQFIWTGWDYIGEPTPYGFPARSSYFGIIDLAGFPKDIYYFYQSQWTAKPVLHLFPHWNWIEGQQIDLQCYYSQADEVELYVNGQSQGVRRKTDNSRRNGLMGEKYHTTWKVTFVPGELKVVARKNGKVVNEEVVRTAGAPHHLRLQYDYQGKETTFVCAEVVDRDGNLCPWAEDQVYFNVSDGMQIVGVDNGSQISMERFKDNKRKAFFGKCIVAVNGKGTLSAKAIGLEPATIEISK